MNRTTTTVGLGLVLGFSGLAGCGTDGTGPDGESTGLPPLTAEQRAVVDNMEKRTLAQIPLPEGQIRFVEVEPGLVLIQHQIRIGAEPTRIPDESNLTLAELFQAYAPALEVPREIFAAMDRLEEVNRNAALAPAAPATDINSKAPATFAGTPSIAPKAAAADSEQRSSALTSWFTREWFRQNWCNFAGTSSNWCYETAWQGAWNSRHSHRTNSITCGDTGAARTSFWVNGAARSIVDTAYGYCWTVGSYHGPHGWFGVNLERDLLHRVDYVESTIRFSGWYADEDQFVAAF